MAHLKRVEVSVLEWRSCGWNRIWTDQRIWPDMTAKSFNICNEACFYHLPAFSVLSLNLTRVQSAGVVIRVYRRGHPEGKCNDLKADRYGRVGTLLTWSFLCNSYFICGYCTAIPPRFKFQTQVETVHPLEKPLYCSAPDHPDPEYVFQHVGAVGSNIFFAVCFTVMIFKVGEVAMWGETNDLFFTLLERI